MDEKRVNQLKKFTKVIKGYDTNQVDEYIQQLVEEKDRLIQEISELKIKINKYKEEENLIKSVLISAEQVALETKSSAEREADEIVERAKLEAEEIIRSTSKKSNKYKQDIYKIFNGHEYKLKKIIEGFYSKARHNMEEVQNEISKEIENMITRYDEDYRKYDLPNVNYEISDITELEVIVESSIDDLRDIGKSKGTDLEQMDIIWREKEENILCGKKLEVDLRDSDGSVVLEKGVIITRNIIKNIIEKGLYGELLVVIDAEESKNGKLFDS